MLQVGFIAQALAQQGGALDSGGKAGLLWADRRGAERADFRPPPVLFMGAWPTAWSQRRIALELDLNQEAVARYLCSVDSKTAIPTLGSEPTPSGKTNHFVPGSPLGRSSR
jgi:hypothetical protein